MNKVLVLLSTYNGEKYIRDQLDSILQQEGVDVTILCRDDGSKDATLQILNEYQAQNPSKIIIEEGVNVGCGASFYWLIKEAASKYIAFDYYAFADQDDVWFKDKLVSGINALNISSNKYKVYFCNVQMVNENLTKIPTKHTKTLGTIEETFVYQPCIGCSMIMSRDLIIQAAKAEAMKYHIHDTWTYLINLILGGIVIQDESIHMLYRQHSTNTVGYNQSFKKRWKRRIMSYLKHTRWRSSRAKELMRVYDDILPENSRRTLELLSSYDKSIMAKLRIITSLKFKTNKKLHNLFFKIAILTNRI